ncbi:Fur family transcriptional regulator [Amycolatopsis rhabdoformis]|uniref:Fur family transcriptional regulator n=1 Tax=Amycolatopsis rhabdoformis TaxID=1448059 RepID=A0ABZ1HY29_9PSEU|nr:Fur family transcriptional regulator [Amycolatopsis rhabdoformis]WSE26275.1 Fur family transcriptional regulator [Amycolatopsis rhabdoformis]
MPVTDPAEELRSVSLRVTKQRTAVLRAVAQRPHVEAEAVAREVRAELGAVSTQAVYDILAALGEVGLVRRIEPAGSPARFEVRTGDNHHHVVCRGCGAVADVDCVVGERPCLAPSDTGGFVVDEAEVTYWGYCPSCQEN